MALYLIGDVQGCDAALGQLLDRVGFSPSRDTAYVLGDLVNRGPQSDAVLRRLMRLGAAARCLLGNHDLHLLAVAAGARRPGRSDTLDALLQASDGPALLEWLRHQRLALLEQVGNQTLLMVHAGVLPGWSATQTIALASEVETVLRSPQAPLLYAGMYGNTPCAWSEDLRDVERWRVVVNALTRMRFCTPEGAMEFAANGKPESAPSGYLPWFDVPGRRTADCTVAFGHWSALGWLGRSDVLSLDTGCVWGGCLSALRIATGLDGAWQTELVQQACAGTGQAGSKGKGD